MAGVRNFADPNVHTNGNQTVFEQYASPSLNPQSSTYMPHPRP